MLPLALLLRRRPPPHGDDGDGAATPIVVATPARTFARTLQTLLIVAPLSCCVAMSMPQVHLVAYCGDLGYGAARGTQMLSLMLGCGIVSRLAFGWICDRIGGLRTLLIGLEPAGARAAAVPAVRRPRFALPDLRRCSACSRAVSCRPTQSSCASTSRANEAGARVGTVMMASLFGMALGGWMSGAIFDWTGSYDAAFVNGILWNFLTIAIAFWLLGRQQETDLS